MNRFKNPLKYQQGGSAPTEEQQKLLAAFIDWLPKRVKEFQGMQPEAIAEALDGMSKTPEGQRQVQQLMQQFQQEMQSNQAFRNGGKLKDFICKHSKGGNVVDCGCKQEGGTFKSADKQVTIENFGTAQADTTGHYSYPSTNGNFEFTPYGRVATVWDNTGMVPTHRYADQNWINRHPRRQKLPGILGGHREVAPEGFFENLVDRVNNRVPQRQDGGELTRKEALDLGMQNRGYSRSQARFALRNAKDALIREGARGKEMRQMAREMVAGKEKTPYVSNHEPWWKSVAPVDVPIEVVTTNAITPEEQTYINQQFEQSLIRPYNGSFSKAFGNARKDNKTLFIWNNNPYTTELKKEEGLDQLLKRTQSNLEPIVINEEPIVIEEPEMNLKDNSRSNLVKYMTRSRDNRFEHPILDTNTFKIINPYYGRGVLYKNGGEIQKAQFGKKLVTAYKKVDDFLNPKNKWEKDHPGSRVIGGMGAMELIAPFKVGPAKLAIEAKSVPQKVKYIKEGVQSPYKWLPSKAYIKEAAERGADIDDFLFALKRNPKLGTNPAEMYGKFGNASTKRIKLNPTVEEVENTVADIFEKFGIK